MERRVMAARAKRANRKKQSEEKREPEAPRRCLPYLYSEIRGDWEVPPALQGSTVGEILDDEGYVKAMTERLSNQRYGIPDTLDMDRRTIPAGLEDLLLDEFVSRGGVIEFFPDRGHETSSQLLYRQALQLQKVLASKEYLRAVEKSTLGTEKSTLASTGTTTGGRPEKSKKSKLASTNTSIGGGPEKKSEKIMSASTGTSTGGVPNASNAGGNADDEAVLIKEFAKLKTELAEQRMKLAGQDMKLAEQAKEIVILKQTLKAVYLQKLVEALRYEMSRRFHDELESFCINKFGVKGLNTETLVMTRYDHGELQDDGGVATYRIMECRRLYSMLVCQYKLLYAMVVCQYGGVEQERFV